MTVESGGTARPGGAPGDGGREPSRRDVLDLTLGWGAIVWATGVAVPAGMYLWPARAQGPTKRFLDVDVEHLDPGTATVVQAGGKPILVLHLPGGEYRALSAICTHLGCIVHWDAAAGHIQCPCHAGLFAPDGSVIGGPPPRPLPVYASRLVEGRLRIETS